MKSCLTFILLVHVSICGLAQVVNDSVTPPPKPKAGFISNFVFQIDNRSENYYDVRGRMNGVKIGVEFYKRVRTGFGFYANNEFYRIQSPLRNDSISRLARFNYSTYFGELVFYRNFRWEFSTIAAIGGGTIVVKNYDNLSVFPELSGIDTVNNVGVVDIGLNGHFKVFPWLGFGTGVGIRYVNNLSDKNLNAAFRDPYVDFKVKIFLGYIYKGIFKPKAIEAERAYYKYREAKHWAQVKSIFN